MCLRSFLHPLLQKFAANHAGSQGQTWSDLPTEPGFFQVLVVVGGTRHRPGGQTTLLTWWLHTRHPWYTSWVTNRAAAVSPPSCCRPSVVLHCATHMGDITCGGVSKDSPSHGPFWRLHCLLVGCSRPLQVWLSDRHCLGHTQHHCGWHWHLLGQSTWARHSCDPLRCAP